MEQVGCGVIATSGVAVIGVDYGIDLLADSKWLAQDSAMREDSLHRLGASAYVGYDGVVVVGIEPADVAHLPAGIGVKAGVVENHFYCIAGICAAHTDAILYDGQNFGAFDFELLVAFEVCLRKLAIDR